MFTTIEKNIYKINVHMPPWTLLTQRTYAY